MSHYAGRLFVHDHEMHLEPYTDTLAVGDVFEVIRGNGPREGDRMGHATVTGFDEDSPALDVHFYGQGGDVGRPKRDETSR